MPDLREQLQQCFRGRVCLIGLGNMEYGDDGFGVRLAEQLKAEGRRPKTERNPKPEARDDSDFGLRPSGFGFLTHVIDAGTVPERFIGRIADAGFDHVIFLDAVEFGGEPGSVVFLNSEEMVARFPQVSTHKLSLGLLARQVEGNGSTKAWLLGVQPQRLSVIQTESGRGLPHSKTQALSSAGPVSEGFGVRQSPAAFGPAPRVAHRAPLSPPVQTSLELLLELLKGCLMRSSRRERALDLSLVSSAATKDAEVLA